MTVPTIGLQNAIRLRRFNDRFPLTEGRTSVLSFLILLVGFSVIFNSWVFASTFLTLLAIHEMGHYFAAQKMGVDVSLPMFSAFGALINIRVMPHRVMQECVMAYGGPLLGSLGVLFAVGLCNATGSAEMLEATRWALWANLFNLIPFSPMDGGRILMGVTRRSWLVGLPVLAITVYILQPHWISLLVIAWLLYAALGDAYVRNELLAEHPDYYVLSKAARFGVFAAYCALVAFVLLLWHLLH
jgi:Zn-dependent protease